MLSAEYHNPISCNNQIKFRGGAYINLYEKPEVLSSTGSDAAGVVSGQVESQGGIPDQQWQEIICVQINDWAIKQ
jgi:hypothetical protein